MTDIPILRPVLLIDLSAIFRAAWHANENGPTSVAFEATIGGVRRCAKDMDNPYVAVCCDGKGNWRKELSPTYKAHREKQPEALYGLLDKVKARLVADGYLLWECDGFEADDIIATACGRARAGNHAVRIATHDKDLLQLLALGAEVLSTSTWDIMDAEKLKAKFGVEPRQWGDWLALVGDKSDGILGAPGIGPKRATELLNKYLSLTVILGQAEKNLLDETPAITKAITENIAILDLGRKLIDLNRDAPIEYGDLFKVREVKKLTDVEDVPIEFDEPAPKKAMDFDDARISSPQVAEAIPRGDGAHASTVGDGAEAKGADTAEQRREGPGVPSEFPLSVVPSGGSIASPEKSALAIRELEKAVDVAKAKAATEHEATKALTVVEYSKQLEPTSFRDVLVLGKYLYESRLFGQFKNPEAIAAIVMRGREMGIGGATALSVFHVIDDKPCAYAYLIIARGKAHPDCEYLYCSEADDKHAKWVTKNRRNPVETSVTYTYAQAESAQLPKQGSRGPNGWLKNPEDMLVKSAGAKLTRREYPDAALGLYSVEEMGGIE